MAVGDVYEVIDVQTLQDQEILNVYFYRQEGAFVPLSGTIAQALADEFVETVLPDLANPQTVELLHTEVRVRNLFDPIDQGTAVAGVNGGRADSPDFLPSFNAWGFTLNHDNASVRPGGKRIAGVAEATQDDGIPNGTGVSSLNVAAAAMAAPITGGLIITDDIMFPVVVQRVREGAPGSYTYRLPENSGELVFGQVIEALVKLFVTSQISRKVGVGV